MLSYPPLNGYSVFGRVYHADKCVHDLPLVVEAQLLPHREVIVCFVGGDVLFAAELADTLVYLDSAPVELVDPLVYAAQERVVGVTDLFEQ